MAVTLHLSEDASDRGPESSQQVHPPAAPPLACLFLFSCFVSQDGNKGEGEKVHTTERGAEIPLIKKKAECFCKAADEGPELP